LVPVCCVPVAVGGPRNCDDSWDPSLIFDPKFCWKPTWQDTKDPMKVFLAHTMLFVGTIWKDKSDWFLFVMSLWLLLFVGSIWKVKSVSWFLFVVSLWLLSPEIVSLRSSTTSSPWISEIQNCTHWMYQIRSVGMVSDTQLFEGFVSWLLYITLT
jgi:hypothetical protein